MITIIKQHLLYAWLLALDFVEALWRTFWDVFFFVSKVVLLIAFFVLLAIGLQQAGALK